MALRLANGPADRDDVAGGDEMRDLASLGLKHCPAGMHDAADVDLRRVSNSIAGHGYSPVTFTKPVGRGTVMMIRSSQRTPVRLLSK